MTAGPVAAGVVRVAIDASSAQVGGGLTYLRELVPRLARRDDLRVTRLLARPTALREAWTTSADTIRVAHRRTAGWSPSWWREVRGCADVLLAPTEIGVAPPGVPLVLLLRNCVYDPAVHQESTPRRRAHIMLRMGAARLSGRRACRHIAVSRFAAHVGRTALGLPAERITVVYHGGPAGPEEPPGAAAPPDPASPHGAPTRLLFVSHVSAPFKNLDRLAAAVGGLRGAWSLDVAGHIDERYRRSVQSRLAEDGVADLVRFHGPCDQAQLAALYRASAWLVWPSYGETFGHPLVEAHRAGLGLLVADAASNPEIVGAAATYFDPFDVGQMRAALQAAVDGRLPARAPLPRAYSWERCAAETAAVLRGCAR